MGCCVSTKKNPTSASAPTCLPQFLVAHYYQSPTFESRAPPLVEEETVKEVLSETPKRKPPIIGGETEKQTQKPSFEKFKEDVDIDIKTFRTGKAEEISETSKACSLSESVSTTTLTDKRDEDEEIRKRANFSPAKSTKNRSFSGDCGSKRERVVGNSPNRISEQSPVRRDIGSFRLVQSRDQAGKTMGNRGFRTEPRRRDPGENSDRRSRSPAIRTANGAPRSSPVTGRSPSTRRNNQSPSRTRTTPPENSNRKLEVPSMEGGGEPEAVPALAKGELDKDDFFCSSRCQAKPNKVNFFSSLARTSEAGQNNFFFSS